VVLDEITYMVNYNYLDEKVIIEALENRPANQHVVITGRAASEGIIEASDTVSEVKDIKHAFRANIRAQKGIDL
jgi:cob(I)alamin adenosyltransferase